MVDSGRPRRVTGRTNSTVSWIAAQMFSKIGMRDGATYSTLNGFATSTSAMGTCRCTAGSLNLPGSLTGWSETDAASRGPGMATNFGRRVVCVVVGMLLQEMYAPLMAVWPRSRLGDC
jgi:hypothetical protein